MKPLIYIIRKFRWIVGIAGGLSILILLFVISVRLGMYGRMPSRDEIKAIELPVASEIYSSDGVLLGKYYLKDRTNVTYDDLAPNLILALLATEDVRFFEHKGVDILSMGRVFFKSLILGDRSSGGGSTITQQLAKNLFPRKDYLLFSTLINKLQEIYIAQKLERLYDKKSLLAYYLNTVMFSENAYGIASASRRYFNTSPDSLSTEQSALLVGLLKAPTYYNPVRNPDRALERRNLVLSQMSRYDFIPLQDVDSLQQLSLRLDYTYKTSHDGLAPYFREYLRKELVKYFEAHPREDGRTYDIYRDGLKIYTTLDSRFQRYAEAAVREHMNPLQKKLSRQLGRLTDNHPIVQAALTRTQLYQDWVRKGYNDQEIDSMSRVKFPVQVFTWDEIHEEEMSLLDSLKHYLPILQTGFVAMNPANGAVWAWVGGIDHHFFQYDHVTAQRQTGSIFKPVVYAAALKAGEDPCEHTPNDRVVYATFDNWSPKNSDQDYGGEYSMEGALTYSVNIVAVNMILRIQPQRVIALARELGIRGELPPVPSLALGVADVSILDMTSAFGGITNGGYRLDPQFVTHIEDGAGKIIWERNLDSLDRQRVMTETHSQMMVEMLKNVVRKGTAVSLRSRYGLGGEIAGKTGTSQDQADGWFLGATPNIVAGVWVGADDRRIHFETLRDGQGARTALPIWAKFMQQVYEDPNFREWKKSRYPRPSYQVRKQLDCVPYTFMVSASEFKKWWEQQQEQAAAEDEP